jgi:hypothetical protein
MRSNSGNVFIVEICICLNYSTQFQSKESEGSLWKDLYCVYCVLACSQCHSGHLFGTTIFSAMGVSFRQGTMSYVARVALASC